MAFISKIQKRQNQIFTFFSFPFATLPLRNEKKKHIVIWGYFFVLFLHFSILLWQLLVSHNHGSYFSFLPILL